MKLVEILARELKEWPEGVRRIEQDSSGVSPLTLIERLPPKILPEKVSESAEDSETAIVTRAQWQAAVDALGIPKSPVDAVEWNGEGLPPVRVQVEYRRRLAVNGKWYPTQINFLSGQHVIYCDSDGGEVRDNPRNIEFRPICTPELKRYIGVIIADMKGRCSPDQARLLYRAGYRKQEQK